MFRRLKTPLFYLTASWLIFYLSLPFTYKYIYRKSAYIRRLQSTSTIVRTNPIAFILRMPSVVSQKQDNHIHGGHRSTTAGANETSQPAGQSPTTSFKSTKPPLLSSVEIKPKSCLIDTHQSVHEYPDLIAIVNSAYGKTKERSATRETWADKKFTAHTLMRVIFVLGWTPNASIQLEIQKEANVHGDILQLSQVDNYKTMSQKVITAIHWVISNCKEYKFVLKTDDDMHLDIFKIVDELRTATNYDDSIFCAFAPDWRPIRIEKNKNFISWSEFPHEKLPPFCRGSMYIMPRKIVEMVYNVSFIAPYVWLEDVFITGIIPEYISNHSNTTTVQFIDWDKHGHYKWQRTSIKKTLRFWYSHQRNVDARYELWAVLLHNRRKIR